jgi:MYXO-CTERM domain-containing protein
LFAAIASSPSRYFADAICFSIAGPDRVPATSGVGDSVTFQSTANSTSTPLQTLTASGSDSKTVSFDGLVPYSLSSITTATLSPGAEVLISDSTSVVPEPAAATTLGLFAIGLLARRRRK